MSRAFTLIELLIVIAIIGILGSVILVSIGDQSDSAREGKAKFNVSQAARYAQVKALENKINGRQNAICPSGSSSSGTIAVGTLYCKSTTSNGQFVIYEKYRTDGGDDAWCMDQTEGAPVKIDLDTTHKTQSSGGPCS